MLSANYALKSDIPSTSNFVPYATVSNNSGGNLANCVVVGALAFPNRESDYASSSYIAWTQMNDKNGNLCFCYQQTVKAYVSLDNSSVNLNFTGVHRCLMQGCNNHVGATEEEDTLSGLIVVADLDDYMMMSGGMKRGLEGITAGESLPIVRLSHKPRDKSVFGVVDRVERDDRIDYSGCFVSPIEKPKGDSRIHINSVGEGAMWVCDEYGAFESGDYVTSCNIPGYGGNQGSDFLMNYTVAKTTTSCDFSGAVRRKLRIKTCTVQRDAVRTIQVDVQKEKVRLVDGKHVKIITTEQEERASMIKVALHDEAGNVIGEHEVPEKYVVDYEENVVDENGDAVWEEFTGDDGEYVTEPSYKMRYLSPDGTIIDCADYDKRKAAGGMVYRAAYIGVTYHCG